jgi:hypothetical protein
MRRGTGARRQTAAAALLASTVVLAGCSGGSDDTKREQGAGATATPSGSAAPAAARATVATVTGKLGRDRRLALADAVGTVVDGWLDGAYLGDFPRADYAAAFAGFTSGAAAKAQRQPALMTNAAISARIDRAEATRRSVTLDVLAIEQRAVGVTATVDLAFRTSGALAADQEVTGTLDLTPVHGGWKIFGFSISRTPAPSEDAS